MNRVITYELSPQHRGMRIKTFLRRQGYSHQNLADLKKEEGAVLVDGYPARLIDPLQGTGKLTIRLREQAQSSVPPVSLPVEILYEDNDLLIVNKPAGMPTHPSRTNTANTLANALTQYYREKGEAFVFRCSNRLDRDTSGLTVVAKHAVSAAMLSEMGTRHEITREYLAIVSGVPSPPEGSICAPLSRADGRQIRRIVDEAHGEAAVTHYRTLRTVTESIRTETAQEQYSLVALQLETGRTHQIRVHMQHLGTPIIGDYLYHPDMRRISRQALHAWRLTLHQPITGQRLSFTAPLPEDMKKIIEGE